VAILPPQKKGYIMAKIKLLIGSKELRRIGADQRTAGLECTADDYDSAAADIDTLTAEVKRLNETLRAASWGNDWLNLSCTEWVN
jgi:hypothetical protein